MDWRTFLKYSKYIAVFYAAAFVIGILGIWMEPHERWIWTSVMFFGAALAGNVALGFYQANHKGAMLIAKNDYQQQQGEPATITGDGKTLAVPGQRTAIDFELDKYMSDKVEEEVRRQTRRY